MSFGIKSPFLNTTLAVSYTICTKCLLNEACFYLLIKLRSTLTQKATKEESTKPSSILVMTLT